MISLQEEYLPKEIAQVLAKVRDKANIMPKKQLLETLKNELGENWEDHFGEFDLTPFAAASIGQVQN
ncbi:hypothetical protein MHBO_003515 [Bonamia ostreae]|uniref:ABC1 atypical kinase-like domain-containing protein n=1 Tax=Bonamia ostreae TaxID=126728 RepID=A0ABV2AQN6_9EUKA